jgi:hypothetical protein
MNGLDYFFYTKDLNYLKSVRNNNRAINLIRSNSLWVISKISTVIKIVASA